MEARKKRTEREALPSFNDIFHIVDNAGLQSEATDVALEDLYEFEGHPFKVKDNQSMMELVESIKAQGVIVPALARPRKAGGYELIYGHRRKRASEIAGLPTLPTVIKELSDKEAIDIMVDSNIQRPELLPSEKAFAYAMKYKQVSKQGCRTDLTDVSVGVKLIQEQEGESVRTIQRYIALTRLLPELLEYVDEKKLPFTVGVELSVLSHTDQECLLEVMQEKKYFPRKEEVARIKEYAAEGNLTRTVVETILERKKTVAKKITLKAERLEQFFPDDFPDEDKEELIYRLLQKWTRTREDEKKETQMEGQIDIEEWEDGKYLPKKN